LLFTYSPVHHLYREFSFRWKCQISQTWELFYVSGAGADIGSPATAGQRV
jgi:hypothetical protein